MATRSGRASLPSLLSVKSAFSFVAFDRAADIRC